jgi:Holliday junction resolvasome RuvABC endonuclease subunit
MKYRPTVIAYERVRRHVGTSAAHVYGGLLATLERFDFGQRDLDYPAELMPVEISVWKKATVGQGNATKLDVQSWARRRFRYKATTEDEADALAIAEAVRRIRAKEYP